MLIDRPRIWLALMLRDIRSRRGRAAESFLLTLVEPAGQLALVYFVFLALRREPDFGNSLLLFLTTGVLPYFLFTHVVSRIMAASRVGLPMLPLGALSIVDVAIAQVILETLVIIIVGTVLLGGMYLGGIDSAAPAEPLQLLMAVATITCAAFGLGLFNLAMQSFLSTYRLIWTLIARSLLFFSSVFFVVDNLVPWLREVLSWNPLLHGVVWFRLGLFRGYPTEILNVSYFVGFALLINALGLSAEALMRRRA